MDSDYRRADMIELHDCRTAVSRKGYLAGIVPWNEFGPRPIRYVLNGEGLARLLNHLGIVSMGEDHLDDEEILVLEQQYTEADQQTVKDLHAAIRSANLLDIRVSWECDEDDGTKVIIAQDVSYSGSFTVWWADDD